MNGDESGDGPKEKSGRGRARDRGLSKVWLWPKKPATGGTRWVLRTQSEVVRNGFPDLTVCLGLRLKIVSGIETLLKLRSGGQRRVDWFRGRWGY